MFGDDFVVVAGGAELFEEPQPARIAATAASTTTWRPLIANQRTRRYPSWVEMRVAWILRFVVAGALLAGVLAAPAVAARRATAPTIVVNFSVSGVVTVTLNGSQVGTTSGQPTVIPGGYYSVLLNGPGECINLPLFELSGPGVNIQDDMLGGEVDTHSLPTYFAPNATYTWHIDRSQSIVYTFRTSSDVVGSPATATPSSKKSSGKATSNDVVGSGLLPMRGTLTGVVTAAGQLTVAYKGHHVTSLKAGRYTLTVLDLSKRSGFVVKGKHGASVTGAAFVGKRSMSLSLTSGRWSFGPSAAKSSLTVSVS